MSEPARIVLATYPETPELTPDDALLRPEFEQRGAEVVVVPWSDESFDWSDSSVVVIRSTWDYHLELDRFLDWTDRLEAGGVTLLNSPALIRWNAAKTYLRQLEAHGIPVVPTRWVARGESAGLGDILRAERWDRAVVKPVVSASAFQTWRTDQGSAPAQEGDFRDLVRRGDVMVQPYVSQIEQAGEWSLIYLDDRFSHAVVKRPRPGDFRVQHQFGGSRETIDPPPHLLAACREILEHAPERSVYARIDGCVVGGRFMLMELELIEPELFLATDPAAPAALASAVLKRVR